MLLKHNIKCTPRGVPLLLTFHSIGFGAKIRAILLSLFAPIMIQFAFRSMLCHSLSLLDDYRLCPSHPFPSSAISACCLVATSIFPAMAAFGRLPPTSLFTLIRFSKSLPPDVMRCNAMPAAHAMLRFQPHLLHRPCKVRHLNQ